MELDLEYDSLVQRNYHALNSDFEDSDITLEDSGNIEFFESRDIDEDDESKASIFYAKTCCDMKCNEKISKKEAMKQRLNFMELDKTQQDLVILSHLQSHRNLSSLKNEHLLKNTVLNPVSENEVIINHEYVQYFFAAFRICRDMYLFLYNMGLKRYKNLIKYFDDNGLILREHKSKNKLSTRENVLTALDTENVVQFLRSYASKVAIPLPGRLPQFRNFEKVVKLPSSDTKMEVYRKFKVAATADEKIRIVSETSFRSIWNTYCPEITTMKPATDLCSTCRENNLKLANLSTLTTEEQFKLIEIARNNLENAKQQREFYNIQREKAKLESQSSLLVISFDYAQNVSYPSSPQQVGSSYFKANRKCGLFGINNEVTHVQTNITIDEEDKVGKGANAVISMLDYYLKNNVSDNLVLFADNCAGQNKNNALINYFLWRMIKKMNKSIELNFLLTGHTKFSPDRNFGIVKSKFSKSIVDCHEDLIEVIEKSSPNNFNIAVPSKDPRSKTRNVVWAEWDTYLRQYFKPIPNITKYHHFRFNEDGSVKAKFFANSEEQEIRQATLLNIEVLPLKVIEPDGISTQRAWYLYKEIRPLCYKESSKDLVAPMPNVPYSKPKQKNDKPKEGQEALKDVDRKPKSALPKNVKNVCETSKPKVPKLKKVRVR